MKIKYSKGSFSGRDVIKYLSFTGLDENVYKDIIRNREVIKKAKEFGIVVSTEELQNFADNFRFVRGLETVEKTYEFFKKLSIDADDLEEFCEASILSIMLKDRIADDNKVEEYFINHRNDFDKARIYCIYVNNENLINEIFMQITEDGESFHELARQYSLDKSSKYAGGYKGFVNRKKLEPDLAAKIFNGSDGDIFGPFKYNEIFIIIMVDEIVKAKMNDELKEVIKQNIFNEWLSIFYKDGITVSKE